MADYEPRAVVTSIPQVEGKKGGGGGGNFKTCKNKRGTKSTTHFSVLSLLSCHNTQGVGTRSFTKQNILLTIRV